MTAPNFEQLIDSEELLVMCVIFELCGRQSSGMKHDGVHRTICKLVGQYSSDRIVRSVSFKDDLLVKSPMNKARGHSECGLEVVEGCLAALVKLPFDVFLGESCKGNDNVGVVVDEAVVEIGKPKE